MICPHCGEDTTVIKKEKLTLDFEEIYRMYPRKLGKANGIKKLKREIKTQERFEDLKTAIRSFVSFHQRSGTDPNFIPYFSSFVSSWTDWLLHDAGRVNLNLLPSETTQDYIERIKKKHEEEAWEETDPVKVRSLIDKALGKKTH